MKFKEYLLEEPRYSILVSKVTKSGRGNLIKIMKWEQRRGSVALYYYGQNTPGAMEDAKKDLALLQSGKKAIHHKKYKDESQTVMWNPAKKVSEEFDAKSLQ